MSKENVINVGERVFINGTSSFGSESYGTVTSITFEGPEIRYWIKRTETSTPIWFKFSELDKVVDKPEKETIEVGEDFIEGLINAFNNPNPGVQSVAVTALKGLLSDIKTQTSIK